MALLDTASLIVTPNGYKASKLYSIVPSDGTGDMTFARTGDTATRVNSSGLIETVLANKPRLDYTDSTCPKLLLEPQRTNLLTYSNGFDNAAWNKSNSTITPNSIASPTGSVNAAKLLETTSNSLHRTFQANTLASTGTYSFSIFAKKAERDWIALIIFDSGTSKQAFFNLNTGTIGTNSNVTATITPFANGWYRCTIVGVITSVTVQSQVYIASADNTLTYTGVDTSGVYIYGAQLEAGSFATSYIPTTTASVTRNIDNCTKSSASALIGQTEGTLFFDFKVNSQNGTSTYFGITSGSFTNYILIGKESSVTPNKILFGIRGSGTTVFNDTSTSLNGNFNRCAIAYKSGNYAAYFNGTLVASGTSSITFSASLNLFGFGSNSTFTLNDEKLEIKSAAIWNTRLTNSELAQLTTL